MVVLVNITRAACMVGTENCMVVIHECIPSKKEIDAAPCWVNFEAPYLQCFWQQSLQFFTECTLIPKIDIGTGFLKFNTVRKSMFLGLLRPDCHLHLPA